MPQFSIVFNGGTGKSTETVHKVNDVHKICLSYIHNAQHASPQDHQLD